MPETDQTYPVFNEALLTPYVEPPEGRKEKRPGPQIVQGQKEYEVEEILNHRKRGRGYQYLIKWKGYPSSENSWLPASQMKSASTLVKQFHSRNPTAPRPVSLRLLTAQQPHKEGILSRTCVLVRHGPIQSRLVKRDAETNASLSSLIRFRTGRSVGKPRGKDIQTSLRARESAFLNAGKSDHNRTIR